MEKIKVRCSRLGDVMSKSRSKNELISTSAKKYMKELYLFNTYGIESEFNSKYTAKGIEVEKKSIALANDVLEWNLTFEQIELDEQMSFENDYVTGRVDVITHELLGEIKSSYDATTFPWFDENLKNNDYYYQVQGYLWLTGYDRCTLAYCLVDTPEDIILDEIRKAIWNKRLIEDEYNLIENHVRSKHNISHIAKEKRVKPFVIERNDAIIENMKRKIELCRDYYNTLK
jgi:hypothetical protein